MKSLKYYFKNLNYIRCTKKLVAYQKENQNILEGFSLKTTKNGEPVLTCRRINDTDSIIIRYYVMFVTSRSITCMKSDLIINKDRIKIADIIPLPSKYRRYYNRGYGSVLIQEVINWARNKGYKEIFGEMVSHENNQLRQEQFYRKNGFSIDEQKNLILKL